MNTTTKSPKEIKNLIVKKFHTVTRFAKIIGEKSYNITNAIKLNNSALARFYELAEETEDKVLPGEISDSQRQELQAYISSNYAGNVSDFARSKGVDMNTTRRILSGLKPTPPANIRVTGRATNARFNITKQVKSIFKAAKIKI